MRRGFDVEVGFLDIGRRRIVAAVEPDQQAGVMAEAQHLRTQRGSGDGEVFRGPGLPPFPVIAAAPAEHDEDSILVGKIEEVVGVEFSFEADGVEVQIAHHAELLPQPRGIGAQQHVLRPASAADEDGFAVDAEEAAAAVSCKFRGDFADAELDGLLVHRLPLAAEAHGESLKVRIAHLPGPPELRIMDAQLRELLGGEGDGALFVRGKMHGPLESDAGR